MTVTPTPSNTELTFTWVANYYTSGNILISPVLGITTSGLVSSFTTGGSLKPANAAYVLYGCTSSQNVDAFTSLVFIEPTAAESFNLTFSGGLNNQISADGTYSVAPSPVDATSTYAYTAVFRDVAGTSLGAVPNAGASGASSSFTIAYASLPANVAYIDYNATATGGGQDGEVSQLSITIIPEVVPPPPPPPPPGNDDLELIRSTTGSIIFNQYNSEDSLKKLTGDRLIGLTMTLTDSYGDTMYSPAPVYYELHIKSSNSG